MTQFVTRVGSFGTLYRCQAADGGSFSRGQRVICRTPRGIEIGTVASTVETESLPEGTILRATTVEDELLVDRLEKHRLKAVHRCQERLAALGGEATLVEVEPLFDGATLLFFFLGPVDAEIQQITDELTAEYERNVRSKHFAKLLAEGCGPGCGTDEKAGGCSGSCAVCVVASACGSR